MISINVCLFKPPHYIASYAVTVNVTAATRQLHERPGLDADRDRHYEAREAQTRCQHVRAVRVAQVPMDRAG